MTLHTRLCCIKSHLQKNHLVSGHLGTLRFLSVQCNIERKGQLEFSGLKIRIFVICKIGDIWNTEIIETFRPNWKDLGNWNKSLRKYFYKLIIASLLFCAIFQKGALARVTMMVKVDVPGIGNGFGQEIARFAKTKKNVLHKIQTQERSLPNLGVGVA